MSDTIEFTAVLKKEADAPMMYVDFPFDVKTLFGTRGNVKVKTEYVQWILGAKKPGTRTRRLSKSIDMLLAGKKIS